MIPVLWRCPDCRRPVWLDGGFASFARAFTVHMRQHWGGSS